jgi:DNA-binding CsgD family transcriptional regulator
MNLPYAEGPEAMFAHPHADGAEALLFVQRKLRDQLLVRSKAIRWRPALELAAMALLFLDDPEACWKLSLDFLRRQLDVERVDGGSATPTDRFYHAAASEALDNEGVRSIHGLKVDNQALPAQQIWRARHPFVHPEIAQDRIFDAGLRGYFVSSGTVAKMTTAIFYRDTPVGLVCADQIDVPRDWKPKQYDCFDSVTSDVMAPILFAAGRLAAARVHAMLSNGTATENMRKRLNTLSETEKRVARLVAEGLSYKEIAARTNRSFSTVDHHLRNIREKLQVRSTSKLVSLLADSSF